MPICDSHRIERAADDVVTNTRKVLDASPANQHDRVLLQVVPFTGDVSVDFATIGQAHTSHLAQRRIRLLGCRGKDAQTHTAPLGGPHQVGGFRSRLLALTPPTNELLDRRHIGVPSKLSYRNPGWHPNAHRARMHHPPVSYFRRRRGRRNRSSGGTHVLPESGTQAGGLCRKPLHLSELPTPVNARDRRRSSANRIPIRRPRRDPMRTPNWIPTRTAKRLSGLEIQGG